MTQLRITLHQPYADGLIEAGAVASLRLLSDIKGETAKNWWSQEKPVSIIGRGITYDASTIFELPGGGTYGVEITRPRGSNISLEFLIEEGESRNEIIPLGVSPHEYLAWHQYAGVVRPDPYQREAERIPGGNRSGRFVTLSNQSQVKLDSLYNRIAHVPRIFAAQVPAARAAWEQVGAAIRGGGHGWAMETPLPDPVPVWDDEYATWFLGSPESGDGIDLIKRLKAVAPGSDALSARYPRWIAFHSEGKTDLASVPWPWWGAHKETGEEIRVIYDRVRPSAVDRDVPGHLTVSVLDQRWFGLLEFLASGRLSLTGSMFENMLEREEPDLLFDPEIALYGKTKGPLVATAGAIVLIARAESTEKQHWDAWVENLSKWFPGIPDGSILLGCRRIDQARDLADFDAAFSLLEQGVERGIPFFSATILMLSVALAQIDMDVPEADALRRLVAPVATSVDPEQVFTVIRM